MTIESAEKIQEGNILDHLSGLVKQAKGLTHFDETPDGENDTKKDDITSTNTANITNKEKTKEKTIPVKKENKPLTTGTTKQNEPKIINMGKTETVNADDIAELTAKIKAKLAEKK